MGIVLWFEGGGSGTVDLGAMGLHEQVIIAPAEVPAFGDLITRVDGGWLYHRLVYTPGGQQQIRNGVFVPEKSPPDLYEASNVFDLALHEELLISDTGWTTAIPAYDFVARAVTDGWLYNVAVKTGGQWQLRDRVYVPQVSFPP